MQSLMGVCQCTTRAAHPLNFISFCLQDLSRYGVQCDHCAVHPDHSLPVSYVTVSQETGSRTIVHLRYVRRSVCQQTELLSRV